MRDITKTFPGVLANDAIDLIIRQGEIHSVLGENGAGKTTLMNILSGMVQPDSGTILVEGEPVTIRSPQKAFELGIGTVYQHFALVPTLSILENMVLGATRDYFLNLEAAEQRLRALPGGFSLEVSPHTPVGALSIGRQQRVEILKVLFRGVRVLLLDEPTAVLAPAEVEELFHVLRRLRDEGVAVVLITHKLGEALAVSDRITVLRQGRKAGEVEPAELARADFDAVEAHIVDLMFGPATALQVRNGKEFAGDRGTASAPYRDPPNPVSVSENALFGETAPQVVLALHDVTSRGGAGATGIKGVSLALHKGEILGLAGVDGNGQTALAETIAGQRAVHSGRVVLDGVELANRGVPAALEAGIAYVTDDRLGEGAVVEGSVAMNLALKALDQPPFSRGGILNRQAIEFHARRLIAEFGVKTPGPWAPLGTLSGGNIQKVLLARELAANPRVLVCNKPTSGLDLKTARFILDALRAQAARGTAILFISTELDEILALSDRIGVMYDGRLLGVFHRQEIDVERIGRLMVGAAA